MNENTEIELNYLFKNSPSRLKETFDILKDGKRPVNKNKTNQFPTFFLYPELKANRFHDKCNFKWINSIYYYI